MTDKYLGIVTEKPLKNDEVFNLQISVFRRGKGEFMRKTVRVECIHLDEDVRKGSFVKFLTESNELVDGISITSIESDSTIRSRVFKSGIALVIRNVAVTADEMTTPGFYQNATLGLIDISETPLGASLYSNLLVSMSFSDDSFSFRLEQAETISIRKCPEMSEDVEERFKLMPEVIQAEFEHKKQEENIIWKSIGPLKLVKTAQYFFQGAVPIFKLIHTDKAIIFAKVREAGNIIIQKLIQSGEVDEYVDDTSSDALFATVFPTEDPTGCYIKLNSDYRHRFAKVFKHGDVFRFESTYNDGIVKFWANKRQDKNNVFRETMKEGEIQEENEIVSIVEEHMMDPETLSELKNRPYTGLKLNDSQNLAVAMAMNEKRKLVCIQGPPGTGKTFVLAHIIRRLLFARKKAIVLTPTKEALKNILKVASEVLEERKLHKNTLMTIWKFNELFENSEEEVQGMKQLDEWRMKVEEGSMTEQQFESQKAKLWQTMKFKKTHETMSNVSIVFSTIGSSFVHTVLNCSTFVPDLCIIDEAAQVMEAETWPAAFRMKRIILAGDPKQLPALVFSEEGQQGSLDVSVMERIMSKKEHFSWVMLNEQYRSNKEIMEWSNKQFYDENIKTMVHSQRLINRSKGKFGEFYDLFDTMVLVDTSLEQRRDQRCFTFEQVTFETVDKSRQQMLSYANIAEANIVVQQYINLVEQGVKHKNIAIITPYSGQVELITNLINEKFPEVSGNFNVGTVDSYQGQEFDAVLCSLVRSNPRLNMGFVTNLRRLNVVITRARKHFMLVTNGFMLLKNHKKEIQDLYNMFVDLKRRFPPSYVFCQRSTYNMQVCKNNFGMDFVDFIEYSRDENMKKWCKQFVQKGRERRTAMIAHTSGIASNLN